MSKVMVIHNNAEHFNDDCDLFDIANEDLENGVAQTAWDSVTQIITQEVYAWDFSDITGGVGGNIY